MGLVELPVFGYVEVVVTSMEASARTSATVLRMDDESVMAVPKPTRQQLIVTSRPSAESDGNPDVSCQMYGDAVGLTPRDSVQVAGSTTDVMAPVAHALYSSRKTGKAVPTADDDGKDELPTRTTSTESGWKTLAFGVRDGVTVAVGVCDGVCVGVGVPELDGVAPLDSDGELDAVLEALDVEVAVGAGEGVTVAVGVTGAMEYVNCILVELPLVLIPFCM